MTRRFPMTVTVLNEGNDTLSQLNRMWFTHG